MTHDSRTRVPSLESVVQDLKYAVRGFRREPAMSLIAVVILALGIGANTAVFSIVNPLLLRPLPFPDSDRLVWIANTGTTGLSGRTYRVDVFEELRRNTRSIQEMSGYFAFFGFVSRTLTGRGDPERLMAVDVAPRFFEVLGVQPASGRLFTEQEHHAGGPRAVLLTHGLWQRRFGGDPGLVGTAISINNEAFTVVGVLPPQFDFSSVFTPGTHVDMFVPADLDVMRPWGNTLSLVGRLRPDATVAQARAELTTLMPRLIEQHRDWGRGWGAITTSLKDYVSGRMRRSLLVLWAAVGFVLLIVCANLANLLLARASARSREFAVRLALGAERSRLVRQLLTEGVVLSLAGAAIGVPLAFALTSWLTSSDTLSLPLLHYVKVDAAALAMTAAVAVITGLLFATVPALKVSARAPQSALQEQSRGAVDSARHAGVRRALVVAEIALAAVLLVGAGLLGRSFIQLLEIDLGFTPAHALAARIETPSQTTPEQQLTLQREIARRVSALPGVEAAGLTDALPLDRNRSWGIWVPGVDYPDNRRPGTFVYVVGPGYLRAMGIQLKAGRDFSDQDVPDVLGKPPRRAVILNETLARILYPGVDPIGRPAQTGSIPLTIVGVVADVRQSSLEEAPASQMYLAMSQGGAVSGDLIVRTSMPASSFVPVLRKTLAGLDARLMATDVRLIEDLVDRAVSPRRFMVSLLGGFSLLALILASLGIYGVVSYGVTQRVPEIGVRMALGATAADVRRQVMGDTIRMALLGIALGAGISLALAKVINSLLFATSATDPLTFAVMVAVLGLVAAIAGYLPARRASKIDPMRALNS